MEGAFAIASFDVTVFRRYVQVSNKGISFGIQILDLRDASMLRERPCVKTDHEISNTIDARPVSFPFCAAGVQVSALLAPLGRSAMPRQMCDLGCPETLQYSSSWIELWMILRMVLGDARLYACLTRHTRILVHKNLTLPSHASTVLQSRHCPRSLVLCQSPH